MSKNIFVGNLSFQTTADDLSQAFGEFGTVTRAQVCTDRETGRSRGFGFVEMDTANATSAISALDGCDFQGRSLRVNEAQSKTGR